MTTQRRLTISTLVKIVIATAFVTVLILTGNQNAHAASPQVVGVAPPALNSLEYVGKLDQTALAINGYGYFTYISGIPDEVMFTNPIIHSEATARFTFTTSAQITARSVIETVFVINATGNTTLYFNDTPKADFKDSKSFASGTAIATASERWQSVINVQSPDTGIATGIGEYSLATTIPFTVNSQDYVLGRPQLTWRFTYTGEGKRTDKIAPNSTLIIAGNATTGGN